MFITKKLVDQFQDIIGTATARTGTVEDVFIREGSYLSASQQLALVHPFSAAEVKVVMWDIDDDKSPGIDGYTAVFFKSFWSVVDNEVTVAVFIFFSLAFF
ncbi:hypothetical protein Droror1_Dr00025371 [Drosera rotundifolia]